MSRSSSVASASSQLRPRSRFGQRPDPFPMISLIQRELRNVQGTVHELKMENVDLGVQLTEAKEALEDQRLKLVSHEQELKETKTKLAESKAEIGFLRLQLKDTQEQLDQFEQECQTDDDGEVVVRRRRDSPPPSPFGDFPNEGSDAYPFDDEYAPCSPR